MQLISTFRTLNTWFPCYLENLENLEFCYLLFQAWKMLEICSKPRKNMWFVNSVFQDSLFKMSFTKKNLIYIFVIYKLSTQTLIQSQIDLEFDCFYLENT